MSQKEKSKQTQTSGYTPEQTKLASRMTDVYSPYIGTGTQGGLSDIEESALAMLRNADVWAPMTGAARGLLTGELGAQPISPEQASRTFENVVVNPTMKSWGETWKPQIKEEYAGPGYWGSARAHAVTEGAEDVADWLGSERSSWMWDVEQANREIEEAKAGRALSALGVTPGALSSWTGSLLGQGGAAREVANAITDPEVLSVIEMLLGDAMGTVTTRSTSSPSVFNQAQNWLKSGSGAFYGLGF